jgi:hypothetical protein
MILSETLGMKKVRAKVVPENLITDQLQQMRVVRADLQGNAENDQIHNCGFELYSSH